MMRPIPINLAQKASRITKPWLPSIIAGMNDYHFKLAKLDGEFIWHSHSETDEAFIVLDGMMQIDFRDGVVALGPGEMYVVPKGVEHRPTSEKGCTVLLVEPAGTLNTGESGGERTVENPEWI